MSVQFCFQRCTIRNYGYSWKYLIFAKIKKHSILNNLHINIYIESLYKLINVIFNSANILFCNSILSYFFFFFFFCLSFFIFLFSLSLTFSYFTHNAFWLPVDSDAVGFILLVCPFLSPLLLYTLWKNISFQSFNVYANTAVNTITLIMS